MSVTTSSKSFRDMTRREAIDLCFILEEQRDKALGQRDALAAKVADARALAQEAIDAIGTGGHSHWREGGSGGHCGACERQSNERDRLRAALDASETP